MKKEIKNALKYHSYYSLKSKTDEYKSYLKEREKTRIKHKSDKFRNDESLSEIVFCDLFSNADVACLIKNLYRLPTDKFVCKHSFKKPSWRKKYDYVHLKNGRMGSGIFTEISFINHGFIKSIDIFWSQINNYYACMEYHIIFKIPLDDDDIEKYVDDNIKDLGPKDFISNYLISDDKTINYINFDTYIFDRFIELIQHFITTFLYSKYAKRYSLPYLLIIETKACYDLSILVDEHTDTAYYNKKHNYIIFKEIGTCNYQLICESSNIPRLLISHLIMEYGLSFYYSFVGSYELNLFNTEFSKYSSCRKRIPYNDLIALLNRLQGFEEEIDFSKKLENNFNKEWVCFYGGKIEKQTFDVNYYKKTYQDSFAYFKTLSEFYASKTNKWVSISALGVSILGIVIALIAMFVGA